MKRTRLEEVAEAVRCKFPNAGIVSHLYTKTGRVVPGAVVVYFGPGKDRIFRGKNYTEVLQQIARA